MNPHRRYKSYMNPIDLLLIILPISLIALVALVLNPIHKKNIEKLKETKPLAQQYTLNQSDPIWFYKPDEIEWTRGEVVYLWGYHPVIFSKDHNKIFGFHEVEWTNRYE